MIEIIELLEEWWLAGLIAIGSVSAIIYKKLKERKMMKIIEQKEEDNNEKKEDTDWPDYYNLDNRDRVQKDTEEKLIDGIKATISVMKKDSKEIDTDTREAFESLRKQLKDVNETKERIRSFGVELGALYKKYQQREYNITIMLDGMDKLIEHKNETKQSHK